MIRRLALATAFGAAIVAVIPLVAASVPVASSEPAPLSPVNPGAVTHFISTCATCHGADAGGGVGPSLIAAQLKHGADVESIRRSIRQGYPATGMPAFGSSLSEAEISSFADYVVAVRANPINGKTGAPSRPTAPTGVVHSDAEDFTVEKVAEVGPAFGFALLPGGEALISQTDGFLKLVSFDGKTPPRTIQNTPRAAVTIELYRRRMFDVSLHPDYAHNGWVYLLVAAQDRPQQWNDLPVDLHRGRIRDGKWSDDQIVFRYSSEVSSPMRMVWDKKKFLYLATDFSNALVPSADPVKAPSQDLASMAGKIFRLTDDGKVPADNPFVGRSGANPYVWSYGHRGTLGLAVDAGGDLWQSENGPRGGDEVNHIKRGLNYGWPVITWGHSYEDKLELARPEATGMEQPVFSFVPSPALGGLIAYQGKAFPRWNGSLFAGSLKGGTLYRLVADNDHEVLREAVLRNFGRIRDLDCGPDGLLYMLTDDGSLFRLRPARHGA